jgi:hypothetical protein
VTATAGKGQVAVSWTAVSGAASYNIYWSATTGVTIASGTKVAGATSGQAISGLTNGTTYYFIVTAVDAGGDGAASSEVSAKPTSYIGGANQILLNLAGAVSTYAGVTTSGSTDGTGSAARFYGPKGITTDGTNLYVSDSLRHTIRKIEIASGVVTTLAGSAGTSGYTDGTMSAARFNSPSGLTTDGTNLYVADTGNNNIRQVAIATGVVTTLAGSATGASGYTDGTGPAARFTSPFGLTTDGTNLYVVDTGNNTIRKIQ